MAHTRAAQNWAKSRWLKMSSEGIRRDAKRARYALRASGVQRGWVVHAEAGLDELCSLSMNHIVSLHGEDAVHLDPASFGCAAAPLESLAGERPVGAARIVEALLSNQGSRAQEDTVLLNAAAVLVLAEAERDLHAAFERCRRALRKGQALRLLEGLRKVKDSDSIAFELLPADSVVKHLDLYAE